MTKKDKNTTGLIVFVALLAVLFSGECFPVADTWTFLTPGGVSPGNRLDHSAVWDSQNNRMLLFGGYQAGSILNDVQSYNGSSWVKLTVTGDSPSGREFHSTAWDSTNNRILLFGGFALTCTGAVSDTNDLWAFDGTGWTKINPSDTPPGPRRYHNTVWDTKNNRLLMFGGTSFGVYKDELWSYDGVRWTKLNPVGTIPTPRAYHAACWDPVNNRMLIFGGFDVGLRNDLYSFDGTNWERINVTGDSPPVRDYVSGVWDSHHNCFVIFGGYTSVGASDTNDAWSFDGVKWTKLNPIGTPPSGWREHSACWDVPNSRMLIYGGTAGANELWALKLNNIPTLAVDSVSVPDTIPANEVTINFSFSDTDADSVTTVDWAYSFDNSSWTIIPQASILGNGYFQGGTGSIKWDVSQFGITKIPVVYFRMKVNDSRDTSGYSVYGPLGINVSDTRPPVWSSDFKAEDIGYGTDNGWVYKVKLSWNPAAEIVGDIIYTLQVRTGDTWAGVLVLTNQTSYEVAGIDGNLEYVFRLKATDVYGNNSIWYETAITCKLKDSLKQEIDVIRDYEVVFENYGNGVREFSKITIPGGSNPQVRWIEIKLLEPNLYEINAYDNSDKIIAHPVFRKPVELTLIYDRKNVLKLGFEEKNLGIFYETERKEWVNEGGEVDAQKHTVTTKINHLSLFRISEARRESVLKVVPNSDVITPNGDMINDYVEFRISYPENASTREVRMEVCDIEGAVKLVKTSEGSNTMIWDGRDSDNRILETGIYIVRLSLEKYVYYKTILIGK